MSKCKWNPWITICGEENNVWSTSCDNNFVLNDGTLKENNFKFCPYCGGEIEELRGIEL